MAFVFDQPTKALFGAGQLNNLHEQINAPMGALNAKKALVVISNGKSTRANGYLDRTIEQLKMAGVESVVYDKIRPNPLNTTADEGGSIAKSEGCDVIVALGGGSVIDAAKCIALMANNDGVLWDYVVFGTGRKQTPKNPCIPIIVITTTAGTGSEADGGAIISNTETHEKVGVFAPGMAPTLAIVDPELMKTVPAKFKAYQGFDALFHSTEGYISKTRNEMSKMVAAEAIRNVSQNLAKTIEDPDDMDAMSAVAFGQYLSGIQMACGACITEHGMEHVMSAAHEDLPHGAGLIMISKAYYQTFIDKHIIDDRFIEMAKLMGKEDASDPQDFIVMLEALKEKCGVSDLKMSDYGIDTSEFPGFATATRETQSFLFPSDPCPLTDEEFVNIYSKSYK